MNIFSNIERLLIERGELVVSSEYDTIVNGADCTTADMDMYIEYIFGTVPSFKGLCVEHVKKLKNGNHLYQLKRETNEY